MLIIFRNIKIDSKKNEFKAILYKNRREEIGMIPSEFITCINYKLRDISTLEMKINKKVMTQNHKYIVNPIYKKIKPKRFIVVNDEERYIIDSIKIGHNEGIEEMNIIAKSFECDLQKKNITINEGVKQLYRNKTDNKNSEEGILNLLEKETSWRIGHIDDKARCEKGLFDKIKEENICNNINFKNVQLKTILFDKDIDMDSLDNKELKFDIKYLDIDSTDPKNNLSKIETITHNFDKFAQAITHIKATYDVDSSFNYVINYEFTLKDGFIKKDTKTFTFLQNLNVSIKNIIIFYDSGEKTFQEKVKYRYFQKNTHEWLTFLRDTVELAFDCIFQFDTYNKIVNAYDRETIGKDEGFYLYYNQYLKSITKDLQIEELITRLFVEGKDGLSINEVNPLGTNYVEDFSFLIKQDNISNELKKSLARYGNLLESINKEWQEFKNKKNEKSSESVFLESQILELKNKLDFKNNMKVALIRSGEDRSELEQTKYIEIEKEIGILNNQLNDLMKKFNNLNEDIKKIDIKMEELNERIKKDKAKDDRGTIFTEEDLNELDEYIYAEKQQDDYYIDSKELYDNALRVMKERNKIPINFTVEAIGLNNHPRGWKNIIKLGNKAHICYENGEECIEDGDIKIVGFKYIPPKKNQSGKIENIEFNNKGFALHDIKSIRNVSKKADYSKAAISFWKNTWIDSSENNMLLKNINETGLNTSNIPIISKSDVNLTNINNSGMWCTDKSDGTKNNQAYIGSAFISVTNDNWNTCRIVADNKGVVAKSIFGTAIVGKRMNMSNPDNTFRIDENGVSIKNKEGKLKARLGFYEKSGETKFSFILYDKTGERVLISEDGISQIINISREDNLNNEIPLFIPLNLSKEIKEIREIKLYLHLQKYRSSIAGIEKQISIEEELEKKINIDVYNEKNKKIEPKYTLKETTMAKNVIVKLNGEIIGEKINEDIEITIEKDKLNKNKNIIEVFSEVEGRINATLSLNAFISI